MNSVQAIMLTSVPVEASLVSCNRKVSDSPPAPGGFEKQFKKACQAQRNTSTQGAAQEAAEPLKAEEDNSLRDTRDDLQEDVQSADSSPDESQNTSQTSESDQQTNSAMAQVMAMPFFGLVNIENTVALQQTHIADTTISLKDQPLNSASESSQTASLLMETGDAAKTDGSTVGKGIEEKAAVFFMANEDAAQGAKVGEQAAPGREQSQTGGRLETGALELDSQVKDDAGSKKPEGEMTNGGKKLSEFESQRVAIVRSVKTSSSSEGQEQSSAGGETEQNSAVLQQLEVEIPKVQVRSTPGSVPNSRAAVDPQDLMDQVVKKAEVMLKDNSSEMTLQLKPGFLGKMTIKIAIDEAGTVTAHFSTSSQQVKNILEQNIQSLRQTLEAQGMKVDRTEVNVQLDSGGMMNDPGGRQQDLWQQSRGIPFIGGFSDSDEIITEGPGQVLNAALTSGYESVENSDGYNFLV